MHAVRRKDRALRLTLWLTICAALAGAAHRADAGLIRIRTDDPVIRTLLVRGRDGSETFRRLYERLERSNLIVHITRGNTGRAGSAFTQFIVRGGSHRFVRITLNTTADSDESTALLGHELQHAAELADDPSVDDVEAYERLYLRIGYQSCGSLRRCFDTAAAVQAGHAVMRELTGRPVLVHGMRRPTPPLRAHTRAEE